jgi:hypothetical protein
VLKRLHDVVSEAIEMEMADLAREQEMDKSQDSAEEEKTQPVEISITEHDSEQPT